MKRLEKILLYVDGSEEAQHALRAAMHLSTISGATIIAVNVVSRTVVTQMTRHGGASLAEVEVELEENGWRYLYAAEDEAKNIGAHIVVLQETGYPEEVLARLAAEYGVDMLIVGVSAHAVRDTTLSRFFLHIVENAPCAVLVVR